MMGETVMNAASTQTDADRAQHDETEPSGRDLDLTTTLRAALSAVEAAAAELTRELVAVRAESQETRGRANEAVAAIQSAAESALQRARLKRETENAELRAEVERLRTDLRTRSDLMDAASLGAGASAAAAD